MEVLSRIDLSENEFSGQVSPELGKMVSLVEINISHNHLRGRLPSIGAFLAINATSVNGNELCGDIANLPPCRNVKNPVWWIFLTCILSSLVLILIAAILISIFRRRQNTEKLKGRENDNQEHDDNGVWEVQFFNPNTSKSSITLSSTRDENVISTTTTLGSLFKVTCSTSKSEFLVEIINENSLFSPSSSFWSEMSRLRHPNIAKLIGTSKSKKGSYGFLVYEYVEGKLLRELVLGGLKWEHRRKIALGISRALCYLDGSCRRGLAVIADLSPEKIVVDRKNEARLRLTLPVVKMSSSTAGCKDYIPSAYVSKETREANEETYRFGLILIELLTGRTQIPINSELVVHRSVVEWARYCYADCHLETWIDPTIIDEVRKIGREKEIVETMNLALRCTDDDPMVRPCARDLVKVFEYYNGRSFSWLLGFNKSPSNVLA